MVTDSLNRRSVLKGAGALPVWGLAGCVGVNCDCVTDLRSLQIGVRPLNRVASRTPSPVTDAPSGSPSSSGQGDSRWTPVEGEPWRLELSIRCVLVASNRGPFRDVEVAVYGDGGGEIGRTALGDVSTENGYSLETTERNCCPGSEEVYSGLTSTLSIDRFPRHLATFADRCDGSSDHLEYLTFDGSEYDRGTRRCTEGLPFR